MTHFLLNAAAFVLAAAASATTFGGAAMLAKHQYIVAEHLTGANTAQKPTLATPRARHA